MNYFKLTFILFILTISAEVNAQNKEMVNAFSKSYSFQEQTNYDQAIAALNNVYSTTSYEVNIRLGWLHYLAGNNAKSIEFYKKAAKIMPAATEPQWNMITTYSKTENWVEIEKLYISILKLDPKNASANYNLGLIYYYRKEYTTAKKYFDVSLNLKPFGYNNMLMSGWTNYFLGNTNHATILFNKVLLYSPNDASALEGLQLIK
jgi:tetratricopeptide (TPR) repeat protein